MGRLDRIHSHPETKFPLNQMLCAFAVALGVGTAIHFWPNVKNLLWPPAPPAVQQSYSTGVNCTAETHLVSTDCVATSSGANTITLSNTNAAPSH